ncbi:CapA family protein [Actinocrispum wychmicini]|uniref:Poly-gamma-glutamate synthesis protein (Capsule biosynthesis protein) n=1 Tax=Actinocrispum wychmicini TaxID=1213861 RepID=A0A4V2S744_9PSEU|nr:CapA family protein [Actinocrispum wychmicini]TCO58100.1 poly-gamma-glutamate synthesis protein (capsule biosynthesis protein) [Actinocrispum wychmicini]
MRRLLLAISSAVTLVACGTAPSPGDAKITVPSGSSQPPAQPLNTASAADPTGFTLVASGDVLIHPPLTDQATQDGNGKRDYSKIMAGVNATVSGADLAICHMETPIAPASGPFKGYPEFSAPPEIVTTLKDIGYDDCSTASNHTIDQGDGGVKQTLDTLDAAGIKHTGSARSAEEARKPLIMDVKGVKVGHVSFAFGFNGHKLPADEPWLANTIDPDAVIAAAKAARAAGAEVVVVSLHWGTEYVQDPTAEQKRIAQKLLNDPNIDLIIGHHAHVVQPFEKINGKWVAYGMGNEIARHSEPKGVTEEGVIARFHFTKKPTGWTVDKAEYVPLLIDLGPPIRLLDLSQPNTVDAARRNQALQRTDQIVLSRGAGDQGLTRPGK